MFRPDTNDSFRGRMPREAFHLNQPTILDMGLNATTYFAESTLCIDDNLARILFSNHDVPFHMEHYVLALSHFDTERQTIPITLMSTKTFSSNNLC